MDQLKADMLEQCRREYQDNERVLEKKIKKIRQSYIEVKF